MHELNWKLYYGGVQGQIYLAAQFTSGVLWYFQNSPWKAGQKWDLPHPPPPPTRHSKTKSQRSEPKWLLKYHTQLLQVSARSSDHNFWPLEHFLRQWHLNWIHPSPQQGSCAHALEDLQRVWYWREETIVWAWTQGCHQEGQRHHFVGRAHPHWQDHCS